MTTLFANNENRISISISGVISAKTAISVSRPDDNFKSLTADDKKSRLPRAGAKRDGTKPFIPGSSMRGALRRSALDVVASRLDRKFNVDQIYMLTSGVDTTKLTSAENNAGAIDEEASLRVSNPLLSLFGRWQLPGHLGMGDMIPQNIDCIFTAGAGVRTNEFIRNPSAAKMLSPEDLVHLKNMLESDTQSSSEMRETDKEFKKLILELRGAELESDKKRINEALAEIESKKKAIRDGKIGSENTIQRPLPGFEAIIPGTSLDQRIDLRLVNKAEMGLFLEAMANFARNPIIGGHGNYACGAITAKYTMKFWPQFEDMPIIVAEIEFDEDGFRITGPASEELYAVRKYFNESMLADDYDFTKFLISEQ